MKRLTWLSLLLCVAAAACGPPPGSQKSPFTRLSKAKEPPTIPPDAKVVTTPSGLKYYDEKEGTGPEAKAGDQVVVEYTGRLEDGTQFDSSRDRSPFRFQLGAGHVIKGWDEGIAGMKVGGKRKLIIPPDLGYGAKGSPPAIPGNAVLYFDVELLQVNSGRGE